jgi:hypothetical protein
MSDCPICFEVINDAQNMVITVCRHKFHATCLFRSTQSSGYRCPNCRGSLLATDAASMGATGAASGPTGASRPVTYHGAGATAIRDISMNIIRGPNRTISEEMQRISAFHYRVTYHNDSSDDESGVNGG